MKRYLLSFFVILSIFPAGADTIPEVEPNDSASLANPISINDTISGNLSVSKEKDYYVFSLDQAGYLTLATPDEQIISSNQLLSSNGKTTLTIFSNWWKLFLLPGRYFISVSGHNIGKYKLFVNFEAFDSTLQFDPEPNNNYDSATEVKSGDTFNGVLGYLDTLTNQFDSDWVCIKTKKPQRICIQRNTVPITNRDETFTFMLFEGDSNLVLSSTINEKDRFYAILDTGMNHIFLFSNRIQPYSFSFTLDDSIPYDTIPKGFDSSVLCYSSMNYIRCSSNDQPVAFSGCKFTTNHRGEDMAALQCKGGMGTLTLKEKRTLSSYTLSFWAVISTDDFSDFGYVITVGDSSAYMDPLSVMTNLGGGLLILFPHGNEMSYTNTINNSTFSKWNGRWRHYVITRESNGDGKLYVNGLFVQSLDLRAISNASNIYVGKKPGSSYISGCSIDEVILLDHAVDADVIRDAYHLVSVRYRNPPNSNIISINNAKPIQIFSLDGKLLKPNKQYLTNQILLQKMRSKDSKTSKTILKIK